MVQANVIVQFSSALCKLKKKHAWALSYGLLSPWPSDKCGYVVSLFWYVCAWSIHASVWLNMLFLSPTYWTQPVQRQTDRWEHRQGKILETLSQKEGLRSASKKFHPCFVKAADTVMRCPRVHGSAGCWQRARLFPRKEAEGDKACIQYFPGDGSVYPVWAFSIFAAWCLFALGSKMTWWDLGEARGPSIASWSKKLPNQWKTSMCRAGSETGGRRC